MNRHHLLLLATLALTGCADLKTSAPKPAAATAAAVLRPLETVGTIDRLDPALDALIPPGAKLEKLAEGFIWAEGPVWMGTHLLFTDVPTNAIFKWEEGQGVTQFRRPSGYTGSTPRGGEPGANGLTRDLQGRLVLCQHGDRMVSRLEANGKTTPLAEFYRGRRFNSPNDLVFKSNGDLYFTDPPYGLVGNMADPLKELPFQGVYRVKPDGTVTLLTEDLSRPNGLAFSPDERTLYVANSDPQRAIWNSYPVKPDGTLGEGRLFFDATEHAKTMKGLPDGLKLDASGNLFATGPGGVLIFSPAGKHLGTINTGEPTANCAWGNDGSTLYVTVNHWLCRIKTTTRGRLP